MLRWWSILHTKMPPSVISLSSQWQRHASNDIAIFHMDDKSSLFTLFFLLFYFRLLQVFPAFFRWRLIDQQADRAGWRWTLVQCVVMLLSRVMLCAVLKMGKFMGRETKDRVFFIEACSRTRRHRGGKAHPASISGWKKRKQFRVICHRTNKPLWWELEESFSLCWNISN